MYRKHYRLTDLSDKNSAKKVFLTITYKYGQGSHVDGRVAKEISGNSGVGEGERISVLKDFHDRDEKVAVFRALFLVKTPRMAER